MDEIYDNGKVIIQAKQGGAHIALSVTLQPGVDLVRWLANQEELLTMQYATGNSKDEALQQLAEREAVPY